MDNNRTMDAAESLHDFSNKALVERNIMPQGIPLVDPDAVAKSSQQDLLALAAEIEKADSCIKANVCNKLQVIAEQIRFLQKQTHSILLEAVHNANLHHVACNFVKKPDHVYHLYQRESGQLYFSMLSPQEWGNSAPLQNYKGSFRLEQDRSWTSLSQLEAKDNELNFLDKFLSSDVSINTFSQS